MRNDLGSPQRQSLIGILVMFADTLQKSLRALWPLVIVYLLRIDEHSKLYFGLGALAVTTVIGVIAYLKYRNFTFHLDEQNEEFVINEGVFNKSRLAIPLDKIQQVNINQSLLQKIIGVHALEVDTAGSAKKEVAIKAITHDIALSLKSRLLEGGAAITRTITDEAVKEDIATGQGRPFIQISLLSLFKTGITSKYARSFGLLLAFAITIFQYIDDFFTYSDIDDDPLYDYLNAEVLLKFITIIIIGIIVLTLVVNLSRTIIKYYNFRITKQQNSLLLSYGLLNTKNTIIRPEKVQILTIGRNYFQKKLDILDLKIRQASNLEPDPENKRTAIEIPGCSEEEKNVLLQYLLEKMPEYGMMLKPNIRKLIMGLVFFVTMPVGIFFTFATLLTPSIAEYTVFVPFYVVFVGSLLYFAYRNSRLFINREFIIKQSGAWDIDTDFLAPHKIQTISLKQYFWQKKTDIGIVTLYTAGGDISFGLADYTRLKELVNYWLYQVETSQKHWM